MDIRTKDHDSLDSPPDSTPGSRQIEQLALLSVAILLGLFGFLVSVAWIAALVVLALLWGFQASGLRSRRADGGVVSAVVSTAVDEARKLAGDVTPAASPTASPTPSAGADGDDEDPEDAEDAADARTKQDLYEEAQREDIAGRSTMSKDELRAALGS